MTGTGMPHETAYHRWVGWHAPAMRRAVIVIILGLTVALALLGPVRWELAVTCGWDTTALGFLGTTWPIIVRADGAEVRRLSAREDETRLAATVLLLGASVASLLGVGFALGLAGRESGSARLLLIAAAMLTVMLSWVVINTLYTLRYAHLHFASPGGGIAFDDSAEDSGGGSGGNSGGGRWPDYRDFAYLAFTIGMTYQVSDTTLRNRRLRRTVLSHAILSYLFGVVIVSGSVSLIAGLVA